MRDEQLEQLLSDFRAIADEQMKDLTLTEAQKQRILQSCLSSQAKQQSEKAVPFWKRGSALRKWGTAAAAAAVLLVAALGGAKVFLTGAKNAYQESASSETAAEEPEMAQPALDEAAPEDKGPEFFFAEGGELQKTQPPEEPDAAPEKPEEAEQIGETPAPTPRPAGNSGANSASSAAPKPAEEPEVPPQLQQGGMPENEQEADDGTIEAADADGDEAFDEAFDEADDGETIGGTAGTDSADDTVVEQPAEEEPPADGGVYPGATRYLTVRIVSCETVYLSLADGMPAAKKSAASGQSGEEAAVPAEEEPAEEAPEPQEAQPHWREALSFGTVEGDALALHVATVTVDLVHWGGYISPGTLLKVIVPAPLESGQSATLLLAPTAPQTGPNAGVPLRVDLAAPWYALGFTGGSAEEIDAVTKALG